MNATVIYKETIVNGMSSVKVIEVEKNEAIALKYAKLYNYQIPVVDREKISYRTLRIAMV